MNPGKYLEDKVASDLGTKRSSGPWRAGPDVRTGWCIVECKHRKTLPSWIKGALNQARRYANEDQIPLVVLHELHKKDRILLVYLEDFANWIKKNLNGEKPQFSSKVTNDAILAMSWDDFLEWFIHESV